MKSQTGTLFLVTILQYYSGNLIEGSITGTAEACREDQLKRCADNAEPLLKDTELVVPDSQRTVNQVCSLWNNLTSCINNYTKTCMTRGQRMEFDRTFQDPVSSMWALCQNQEHRKDYLNHAPCVKKISTEGNYCGNQYRFLIDLVSGSSSTIKQICCARAKFKNCILAKTPSRCDSAKYSPSATNNGGRSLSNMNATAMAISILDKSLAFISHRCESARFQEADCPGIDSSAIVRTNSKGPLESPGLAAAASGEASQSQFQLDQASSRFNRTNGRFSTTRPRITTPRRPDEEKPINDKLSAGKDPSKKILTQGQNQNGLHNDESTKNDARGPRDFVGEVWKLVVCTGFFTLLVSAQVFT